MKSRSLVIVASLTALTLGAFLAGAGVGSAGQPGGGGGGAVGGKSPRPYHDGSVWATQFIRIKPGMEPLYMAHITGPWKTMHEAMKKEGLILSYKVLTSESHTPMDWNIVLMTEFKDLATMEANQQKEEAAIERILGDDEKQIAGYKARAEIREVIGERLAREVILEPRK